MVLLTSAVTGVTTAVIRSGVLVGSGIDCSEGCGVGVKVICGDCDCSILSAGAGVSVVLTDGITVGVSVGMSAMYAGVGDVTTAGDMFTDGFIAIVCFDCFRDGSANVQEVNIQAATL